LKRNSAVPRFYAFILMLAVTINFFPLVHADAASQDYWKLYTTKSPYSGTVRSAPDSATYANWNASNNAAHVDYFSTNDGLIISEDFTWGQFPDILTPGMKLPYNATATRSFKANDSFTEGSIGITMDCSGMTPGFVTGDLVRMVSSLQSPDGKASGEVDVPNFGYAGSSETGTFSIYVTLMNAAGVICYEYIYKWQGDGAPSATPEASAPAEPSSGVTGDTAALGTPQEQVDNAPSAAPVDNSQRVDTGARFSSISGVVDIIAPDGSVRSAKLGSILYADDIISTGEDSNAILGFSDMSTFLLKDESAIVLNPPAVRENKLKLVAGKLWIGVKQMYKDGEVKVESAQAVAGIKGTILVCEENNGVSTLKVIEGKVQFTSKADGKSVMVSGGEMVTADKNGLSGITKINSVAETMKWSKYSSTPMKALLARSHVIWYAAGAIILIIAILTLVLISKSRRRWKQAPAGVQPGRNKPYDSGNNRANTARCRNCGAEAKANAAFCEKCGTKLQQ
jgi:hypothetical protein